MLESSESFTNMGKYFSFLLRDFASRAEYVKIETSSHFLFDIGEIAFYPTEKCIKLP